MPSLSPASRFSRPSVEPLAPALVAVAMAHGFLAFFLWMFIAAVAPGKKALPLHKDLVWYSPTVFLPAVTETPPPAPEKPSNKITLTVAPTTPNAAQRVVPLVSKQMLAQISSQASSLVAGPMELKPEPSGLTINPVAPVANKPVDVPKEAVPEIPATPAATALTGPEANKYITLSPVEPPDAAVALTTVKPVLNLLDIANLNAAQKKREVTHGGADLEPVESALEKAILSAWKAPTIKAVPLGQRRVTLTLSILRDGSLEDVKISAPSGSDLLDASVRAAVARVTKITQRLPAAYPKERYELQVNFQIE